MADETHISWADHTFAPWFGCTKVSPACDGCYAEHLTVTRFKKAEWGPHADRVLSAPSTWKQVFAWNRKAAREGRNAFVFCSHLSDVFDNQVPPEWRVDLFNLIDATPNLTWLLLTKRPQNIVRLYREACCVPDDEDLSELWPRNAWIGSTMVNQAELARDYSHLAKAKAALNPAVIFVSIEPMLDVMMIEPHLGHLINWVISGGETDQGGHKARPYHPDWFRSLRDQCAAAGVPFHHKQWGEWAPGGGGITDQRIDTPTLKVWDPETSVRRVGASNSGRLIDGILHDARPVV